MTELKQRLKEPTPRWFKRIRSWGVWMSTMATTLLAAGATLPGFTLPEVIGSVCSWMVVAGITAGLVSTTAKTSSSV